MIYFCKALSTSSPAEVIDKYVFSSAYNHNANLSSIEQQPAVLDWFLAGYCTFQTGSLSRVTADLLDELPALLVTHTEAPANLYCVTPAPFPKKEMPLSAHE